MTLLELVLAISLLVLVSSAMFGFYWHILRARDRGTHALEGTQLARVVAHQIAQEIRGASGALTHWGAGLIGGEHELRLTSLVLPDRELFRQRRIQDRPVPAQCDVRQIRYYLAYDEDDEIEYPDGDVYPRNLGLVRRVIKTLNQASIDETNTEQVDTDLFAPEIQYVRFRYFDGVDWIRRWAVTGLPGQNALPQAVEVTVGYGVLPPEDPSEIDFEDNDASDLAEPEPYSSDRFTLV
ncbi:MAG: hypothetical protein V3T70_10175, partial [Phycisphaerae bacterium]